MLTSLRVRFAAPSEPSWRRTDSKARQADGNRPSLRSSQLMDRIMELNTTATEEYLGDFSDESLAQYLDHLESMVSPRGARWVRRGDSPAIMVRETEF